MSQNNNISADSIDALLPQTQCKDCGYDGCMPYAKALAKGEADIDLCLPGGVNTLKKLAQLFTKDVNDYLPGMKQKAKPKRLAIIREDECIGCTKCIQACPVDAIIGSSKQMHTILADECTGCELCVAPCPMDCIDLVKVENQTYASDKARTRMQTKNARLEKLAIERKQKQRKASIIDEKLMQKKKAIMEAVTRAKAKRRRETTL